ncbi:MAG: hypothetical protein KDA65_04785 [Planctomycetaceae bacterium]|nr:hypothetical protein [Planctomycetaceae bacterium]
MYGVEVDFGEVEWSKIALMPEADFRPTNVYEMAWMPLVEMFDYNYPFREMLTELIKRLKVQFLWVELKIKLGDDFCEDFVSFQIEIDEKTVYGYFEHSLQKMDLAHGDELLMMQIRAIANEIKFISDKKTNRPDVWGKDL